MRRPLAKAATACALLICCAWLAPAQAGFKDPLDNPATLMTDLASRPFHAVVRAGERLVAVGARGLIAYSDDGGVTWRQGAVPVQSDLVAVHFPLPEHGWAVGHGGVVLHTADGGISWEKQLDGRMASERFTRHYQQLASAGKPGAEEGLQVVKMNYIAGPSLPLLGVWFENAERGYAVGAFGTLLATADGGRSWEPWFHRIDNPEQLHLNSIRSVAGELYIAAERGTIFQLDPATHHFARLETEYGGSFFGLAGSPRMLLAYGLEGSVYRSTDRGDSWVRLKTGTNASITAASSMPDSQGFVFTSAVGDVLIADGTGTTLSLERTRRPARFTSVVPLGGRQLLITSLEGMRRQPLDELTAQR